MLLFPAETKTKPVPINKWDDGSIRIEGTRVLLDLVVSKHNSGYTPTQIVESYDTLDVVKVYRVIAWYLENKQEVDAYIAQREHEADLLWAKIESDPEHQASRRRLQERIREMKEKGLFPYDAIPH